MLARETEIELRLHSNCTSVQVYGLVALDREMKMNTTMGGDKEEQWGDIETAQLARVEHGKQRTTRKTGINHAAAKLPLKRADGDIARERGVESGEWERYEG